MINNQLIILLINLLLFSPQARVTRADIWRDTERGLFEFVRIFTQLLHVLLILGSSPM